MSHLLAPTRPELTHHLLSDEAPADGGADAAAGRDAGAPAAAAPAPSSGSGSGDPIDSQPAAAPGDLPAALAARFRDYLHESDRAHVAKRYRECDDLLQTAVAALRSLEEGAAPAGAAQGVAGAGMLPPAPVAGGAAEGPLPPPIAALPAARSRLLAAALWRSGRLQNTLAPLREYTSDKPGAYRRGLDDVLASLALYEPDPDAHKFAGILLARAARDTRERISNGYKIKEHVLVSVREGGVDTVHARERK